MKPVFVLSLSVVAGVVLALFIIHVVEWLCERGREKRSWDRYGYDLCVHEFYKLTRTCGKLGVRRSTRRPSWWPDEYWPELWPFVESDRSLRARAMRHVDDRQLAEAEERS